MWLCVEARHTHASAAAAGRQLNDADERCIVNRNVGDTLFVALNDSLVANIRDFPYTNSSNLDACFGQFYEWIVITNACLYRCWHFYGKLRLTRLTQKCNPLQFRCQFSQKRCKPKKNNESCRVHVCRIRAHLSHLTATERNETAK